jgi:serine/threonine-protein kinase
MSEKPPESDDTLPVQGDDAPVVHLDSAPEADALGATQIALDPASTLAAAAEPSVAPVAAQTLAGHAMSGATTLSPGFVIADTYEIECLLGTGGMGAVWLASHRRLAGRKVAIKFLHMGDASDEILARFRHEAEAAARIGHEHVVDVLDYNTLPSGEPYIVMEHLEGETLSDLLARGPVELDEALRLARQIALALHAAHGEGVIHRDLKPDNIFLCRTHGLPMVKVLDFGISKIRDSETVKTAAAVVMGTPCYMSPEQAFGESGAADARSDVFSMGAIVYEMLAGQRAFAGDEPLNVLYRVVHEQPTALAELAPQAPAQVVEAVERAMAKAPDQRFPDMVAFIAALTGHAPATAELALAAPSTHVAQALSTGPSNQDPVAPPDTGRRQRPALGFLAGALVVAALGFALWPSPPPPPPDSPAPVSEVHVEPPPAAEPPAGVQPEAPGKEAALPGAAPPSPSPSAPAAPAVAAPPDPPVPVARPAADKSPKPPPPVRPKVERQPPPAALIAAEKAFAAGRYSDALREARKSLFERKTSRAYALMARAHCRMKNLPDAKGAIAKLRGATKRRVQAFCRKAGLSL